MEKKRKVTLICSVCLARNYRLPSSKQERLELNKFCPHCNKHTLHKETK